LLWEIRLDRVGKTFSFLSNRGRGSMEANWELKNSNAGGGPTGVGTNLSRFCLENDGPDSRRALAWTNSICLAFLLIGLLGVKQPALDVNRKPVIVEDAVPTVIEPIVPAVPTITAGASSEESAGSGSGGEGGPVVAVTVDSAAVAFAVPAVGNVLVPLGLSQAPPPRTMQAVAPVGAPQIEQLGPTGGGGSRPAPLYPLESKKRNEQGTVILRIEVDPAGRVAAVAITQSSGYRRLDEAARDQIQRRWLFGRTSRGQIYDVPIIFQLQ
jgi:protein TonB